MQNQNEKLEYYISMLEDGVPLEEVLDQVKDQEGNLPELLSLVSKIKALPDVSIDPNTASKQDAIIQSMIETHAVNKQKRTPINLLNWFLGKPKPFVRVTSFVFFLSILFAAFLFFITVTQTSSASIRISNITGQVEIIGSNKDDIWSVLQIDDYISAGQKVKTGVNSSIELQLPDKSLIQLAEDTEITIDKLENHKKDGLTFILTQHIGSTQHHVSVHENTSTNYIVNTPSNIINVHGTKFIVKVAENGRTFIQVDAGFVNVIGAEKQVTLTPGFATETLPGEIPSTPLHAFSSYGELLKQERNVWEMEDSLIFISDDTIIPQSIAPGDNIVVSGRILPNGNWLADYIKRIDVTDYQVSYSGNINFISPELWVVDDKSIQVTKETKKPDNLSIGDLVRIIYINQNNGRRKALEIEPLSYSGNLEKFQDLSEGKLEHGKYGLSFVKDEITVEECDYQYDLIGDLVNNGNSQYEEMKNVSIDYQILNGKKFVKQVVLEPSFWEEIPSGDTIHFSLHVELSDDWLSTNAMSEIKLKIRINKNIVHPDSAEGLLIRLKKSCDYKKATQEEHDSEDINDSEPEKDIPIENIPTNDTSCVGVLIHPEGQQLANIYAVSYDEIMGWFCDGFGFGEIDLAYYYAQIAGINVDSIFELVRSGLDWGEIINQLGLEP